MDVRSDVRIELEFTWQSAATSLFLRKSARIWEKWWGRWRSGEKEPNKFSVPWKESSPEKRIPLWVSNHIPRRRGDVNMDLRELEARITQEIIAQRFPDMLGAHVSTSEVAPSAASDLPVGPGKGAQRTGNTDKVAGQGGYEVVFRKGFSTPEGRTFHQIVAVITDVEGNVQRIVRSR
jgi:hypothetical protein